MRAFLKQHKKIIVHILIALVLSIGLLSATHVFAQGADTFGIQPIEQNVQLPGTDIRIIVGRIIRAALGLLGVIALGLMIYAGFLYMTSGGNEETIGKARKVMINAAIGLVIILSALAIVQFVLNQLNAAIRGEEEGGGIACQRLDECNQGDFGNNCIDNHFVAMSVTPSQAETGMNNVAVRAVFSKGVGSQPDQVFGITRDGNDAAGEFTYHFVDGTGQQVVEAVYPNGNECAGADKRAEDRCVPTSQDKYHVTVNNNVVSIGGAALEVGEVCNGFVPVNDADFKVDQVANDIVPPEIPGIALRSQTGQVYGGDDMRIPRNTSYAVEATITDGKGVGYATLTVVSADGNDRIFRVNGPAKGKSGDPFAFSTPLVIGGQIPLGTSYTLTLTGYDIDHNPTTVVSRIVIVAEHCGNGVQDGDETDVDQGGSCGFPDGNHCDLDNQCASGKCIEHLCVAYPRIDDVNPLDGAVGNFVTIVGKNFGDDLGRVVFRADTTGDGVINGDDRAVVAELPSCNGNDLWHNGWVVVQVPDFNGAKAQIELTPKDSNFTDTTTDDFGPKPGGNGLFTLNQDIRPGLCSVTVAEDVIDDKGQVAISRGATAAPPKTAVVALGDRFGDAQGGSSVSFGGTVAPVSEWSNASISARVPNNLAAGRVGVFVEVDGKKSNGVPFDVLADNFQEQMPIISAIDPEKTTAGSYATIFGNGFDGTGKVFISKLRDKLLSCLTPGQADPDCVQLNVTDFPDACIHTWSNTQIIAQVPRDTVSGDYFVILETGQGLHTSGENTFTIEDGLPRPGICRLDPNQGPAPLPDDADPLHLYGVNFSNNPTVYFWAEGASRDNVNGWLSTDQVGLVDRNQNNNHITTRIPVDQNLGKSMQTGPIKLVAGGKESNSVQYTVSDCRESGAIPGLHCCIEGPEAGHFKPEEFACEGEVRDGGYAWRFTTGRIPVLPYIIEGCNVAQWGDPIALEFPSPVPWEKWPQGKNACVNALMGVRFSTDIDEATLADHVKVYTCAENQEGKIDCDNKQPVQVDLDHQSRVLELSLPNNAHLAENTWYHVEFLDGIMSSPAPGLLGEAVPGVALLKTRPCDDISEDTTAYCFDFKTGTDVCTLVGAGVNPDSWVAKLLGILQDPRYPLDTDRLFDPPHPFYYYVWGRGSQVCSVLDVDGYNWSWAPREGEPGSDKATAEKSISEPRHKNDRATVTALADTPEGVDITASTENITGRGRLFIDLGDPKVIDFWPSCAEACINAEVGVVFDQLMIKDSYANGLTLLKCTDSRCTETVDPGFQLSIDAERSDRTKLYAYPEAGRYFDANTWYEIQVHDVLSIAAIRNNVEVPGNPIEPFTWKFRTKVENSPCLASKVEVKPDPFTARIILERTRYVSRALGAPDACNPDGQLLNPWDYGWSWNVEDPLVASISHFSAKGDLKPYCTLGCLPGGSDIPRTEHVSTLCGDRVVGLGEDCDFAIEGEILGVSCTTACLRPGSQAATCENGQVETNTGEECDQGGDKSQWKLCTSDCQHKGSSATFDANNEGASWCGSRDVTVGEECDVNDPATKEGCSATCVHEGTELWQGWCDQGQNNREPACKTAVSVCGNRLIESGEECEIGVNGALAQNCSDRCLLTSACNVNQLVQCDPGTEGCTDACTLKGSGVTYSIPSLCGDGEVGIGEFDGCELQPGQFDPARVLGENPVQLVTAVGAAEQVDAQSQTQDTHIQTSALTVKDNAGARQGLNRPLLGQGAYHLQCGFTEFGDPHPVNNDPRNVEFTFNDCPNSIDGVGSNSCCYPRPRRIEEYPADGAGIDHGVGEPVCRNTFISVHFNQLLDERTVKDTIFLAKGHTVDEPCGQGEQDVTDQVEQQFTLLQGGVAHGGILWNIFEKIKEFFEHLFGGDVLATRFVPPIDRENIARWCTSNIDFETAIDQVINEENGQAETVVSLSLADVLQANTYYVVFLKGGLGGIRDTRGVSIISPDVSSRDDMWIFRTGGDICRLKGVTVEPSKHVFTAPNTSYAFTAHAESTNGQLIVSTPSYAWQWSWGPANHPVFRIPVENTPADAARIEIGSRDLEGGVQAVAQAIVQNEPAVFSGLFELTAFFCERPWPAVDHYPFEDNVYHFRMSYCSDLGKGGVRTDDLPYLAYPGFVTDNPRELADRDLLRKYLFFTTSNDGGPDNEDVIGMQIFKNPTNLSLHDWYIQKFQEIGTMKPTTVGGHDALTDDANYYISAVNLGNDGNVYSNIYQFSVSRDAEDGTKEVLTRLLDSLEFNTNLTNHELCLNAAPVGGQSPTLRNNPNDVNDVLHCTSDFDCRDASGAPKAGTNGICSNARTKFFRDLGRLRDLARLQESLGRVAQLPDFRVGSFLQGVSISRWPTSWNALGAALGLGSGIPRDPLNQWTSCPDHDTQTCWNALNSTFACPAVQSVYTYAFNRDLNTYRIHGSLEYFTPQDQIVDTFLDLATFTTDPWCQGGIQLSPNPGVCGDRAVNPGEACDPPGSTQIGECVLNGGGRGVQRLSCNNQCTWDPEACQVFAQCGNGRLEGAEVCDDGVLNGTYGHCNSQCDNVYPQYCGNSQLDRDARNNNRPLEYCDQVGNVCEFMNNIGQQLKPEVYIMLDRSGSMEGERWQQATAGLDTIGDQMAARVDFGLAVFSGGGDATCQDPDQKLPTGPHVAQEFKNSYSNVVPSTWTPTDKAMEYILHQKNALFPGGLQTPKIVILITDGDPLCGGEANNPELKQARLQRTLDATRALRDQGVPTYVIGFGNADASFLTNLNAIADAGGTDNPDDPVNRFFTAGNAAQLVNAFTNILSCSPYSHFQAGSCSWNCQGPGGYCGDSVVQADFEQCDDGNQVANDACTNACEINEGPVVAPAPVVEAPSANCGDGIVQNPNPQGIAEVCDLGAQNGIACFPAYNRSCTYCAADCRSILTVDPVAFCGNGIVDYDDRNHNGSRDADEPRTESCDTQADGTVVGFRENLAGQQAGGREEWFWQVWNNALPEICDDKSSYQCANSCQRLVNNCILCETKQGGPIPRLALLNPMIWAGNNSTWSFSRISEVELLRGDNRFGSLGYHYEPPQPVTDHPTTLRNIQLDQGAQYGLESNELCNGEYNLLFNYGPITQEGVSRTQMVQDGAGDLFPYAVKGEGATIDRDMVVSPPVRPGEFRVVVRWTKAEADQNAQFGGLVYSDKFSQANGAPEPPLVSYAGVATPGQNGQTGLCVSMGLRNIGQSSWWLPANAPNDQDNECTTYYDNVSVHPITFTGTKSTVVQSFTVYTPGFNNGKPYAFMVQGLTGYIGSNQYKNSNLQVEVYASHAGQNSEFSVYKPVRVFSIRQAAGTSSNVRAQYWHVFNIVRGQNGQYEIQAPQETQFQGGRATTVEYDNGSIESDICQVRLNMPDTPSCVAE